MTSLLPDNKKAVVVCSTNQAPNVESVPVPQPLRDFATVQVLATNVISYIRDVYNGNRNYAFPTPLIAGTSAIGRVVAVDPDAVKFRLGDLVFIGCIIRARDRTTFSCGCYPRLW